MTKNVKGAIIGILGSIPSFILCIILFEINPNWFLLFFAGMATMLGTWNLYDFLQKRLLKEGDE